MGLAFTGGMRVRVRVRVEVGVSVEVGVRRVEWVLALLG